MAGTGLPDLQLRLMTTQRRAWGWGRGSRPVARSPAAEAATRPGSGAACVVEQRGTRGC